MPIAFNRAIVSSSAGNISLTGPVTLAGTYAEVVQGTDPECVKVVERQITKHGGKVLKNTRAEGYSKSADGSLVFQRRSAVAV